MNHCPCFFGMFHLIRGLGQLDRTHVKVLPAHTR